MSQLKCIIIDDEPQAHIVLKDYIAKSVNLDFRGSFPNAESALDFLLLNSIDLVFLDISMPGMDGFEFMKRLKNKPQIILTTAHSEHAVQSYEFEVTDYLLKPIRFERFTAALKKVKGKTEKSFDISVQEKEFEFDAGSRMQKIPLKKILFFESNGNYVKLYTKSEQFIFLTTTAELENRLGEFFFERIHKSYIVNRLKIEKYDGESIRIDKHLIPVGKTYKKIADNLFGDLK